MDNPALGAEYRQVPQDIDAERAVLGAIFLISILILLWLQQVRF